MITTIVTKQSLVNAVKQFAKTQQATNYGWREIHQNALQYGDGEILEIITDADAYDIVTAIAAVQAVVDALNNDN
jgi:hypothetical protein